MNVRTERDSAVEANAWKVDPTVTGALGRQPSSADTQQGSSYVVSSVSSDSSNMPPGFISLAANRANAADLIRGREALRTLLASAQTAGTAVYCFPHRTLQAVICICIFLYRPMFKRPWHSLLCRPQLTVLKQPLRGSVRHKERRLTVLKSPLRVSV